MKNNQLPDSLVCRYSGGREGGVRPPYRDHQEIKTIQIRGKYGLDTPLEEHPGLLDHLQIRKCQVINEKQ